MANAKDWSSTKHKQNEQSKLKVDVLQSEFITFAACKLFISFIVHDQPRKYITGQNSEEFSFADIFNFDIFINGSSVSILASNQSVILTNSAYIRNIRLLHLHPLEYIRLISKQFMTYDIKFIGLIVEKRNQDWTLGNTTSVPFRDDSTSF